MSRSERRPTDVRELIGDTLLLFRQSTSRHAHIAVELPEEGAILDVDPVLVRHALFNLLANAAQASPPGGAIRVILQPEVGPEQQPGWSLEVQDQGPGLSAAVREKLFTPFFTTRPSGTGLGLALAVLTPAIFPQLSWVATTGAGLWTVSLASWLALNFTGSTPYTSPSGVEKEMRKAIPILAGSTVLAAILFVTANFL
ncbi:MAG: hypothetical protein EOM10_10475 [Opitutae bacterium]|nr:hypothetical protein [Opitutae bacterium]